jgi:hypothetical protein
MFCFFNCGLIQAMDYVVVGGCSESKKDHPGIWLPDDFIFGGLLRTQIFLSE